MRFIELLWLGVAAVSAVEIYAAWGNTTRTLQFTLFFGAAVFFRPHFLVGMPPASEPRTVPQSAIDMMKMP